MFNFEELLNEELDLLESIEDLSEYADREEYDDMGLLSLYNEGHITDEEYEYIIENTKRRVNSRGRVTRVQSRTRRKRNATRTTGMSKTARKQRAKRAARTKKRNPSILRKAMKKRNRAMRKRKMLNIK